MNAPPSESAVTTKFRIALVGNPNVGKTSVFNRLTDLHAKTSNFVGTTVEHRSGTLEHQGRTVEIVDLPGLFSLEGDSPEEQVAKDVLAGKRGERPNAALVIVSVGCVAPGMGMSGPVIH